jgi:hypothetical protein
VDGEVLPACRLERLGRRRADLREADAGAELPEEKRAHENHDQQPRTEARNRILVTTRWRPRATAAILSSHQAGAPHNSPTARTKAVSLKAAGSKIAGLVMTVPGLANHPERSCFDKPKCCSDEPNGALADIPDEFERGRPKFAAT